MRPKLLTLNANFLLAGLLGHWRLPHAKLTARHLPLDLVKSWGGGAGEGTSRKVMVVFVDGKIVVSVASMTSN